MAMEATHGTRVLVLGNNHVYALQVIAELSVDLEATIIGIGETSTSPILRSRYCDVKIVAPSTDMEAYRSSILRSVRRYNPDFVLPIGYKTVIALDGIREKIQNECEYRLPPTDSLHTALDKKETAEIARQIDISVPDTYAVFSGSKPAINDGIDVETLSYPVMLKAKKEAGHNIVSRVDSSSAFSDAYRELCKMDGGGDIMLQEYIDGDSHTYGCGLLFDDGDVELVFGQKEIRSIPREGGTGTRVGIFRDEGLESTSIELLRTLDWDGLALVEYKRREDGSYALMEINPKIWASYPLASKYGYRFVSTMVARSLDIPLDTFDAQPRRWGEMIFPLREIYYTLKHSDEESIGETARAMLWPPARVDVNLRDSPAWIAPEGLKTSVQWAYDLWRGSDDPF